MCKNKEYNFILYFESVFINSFKMDDNSATSVVNR